MTKSLGIAVAFCVAFLAPVSTDLGVGQVAAAQEQARSLSRQLPTRSTFGEIVIPSGKWLGTFAIDLGVQIGEDNASIQLQYVMESIFARAAGRKVQAMSGFKCNMPLSLEYYPFVLAFMYRGSQAKADEQLSALCFESFRHILEVLELDDGAIRGAARDLADEIRAQRATGADRKRHQFPILDVADGVRKFVREIYDDHSAIHALLSVDAEKFESVTANEFENWMHNIRGSGRIRLVSDDLQIRAMAGSLLEEPAPILPVLATPKTSAGFTRMESFDSAAIRAAVLVAVDPPTNGKVRNEVVAKYCREPWNARGHGTVDSRISPWQTSCWFEDVFGRETWVAMYFDSEDGSDSALRKRVEDIAADPTIVGLASRRVENGQVGRPYVVLFGTN